MHGGALVRNDQVLQSRQVQGCIHTATMPLAAQAWQLVPERDHPLCRMSLIVRTSAPSRRPRSPYFPREEARGGFRRHLWLFILSSSIQETGS